MPPSPSPEELAFLESNKSRLSASYHSVHEHDPSSGKGDAPTLFERRNLEYRKTQLSLPNMDSVHSIPRAPSSCRPSFSSSRDTSESVLAEFRYRTTSSRRSGSVWSGDDLSTEATSVWSNAVVRNSLVKDYSSNDSGSESKEEDNSASENSASENSSPEIDLKIHSERKIANARLCDVLRTLFGSNGYKC